MTDELRDRGCCVNHKRVERLMAEEGLHAKDGRRRKVRTTIPDVTAPPLPDLVGRNFGPGEPGTRTCGDITYVPTDEGWLYLADVLDLGSRRVVGFAMADHMRSELVEAALEMAVATRGRDVAGTVFHHDRGAQYMGRDFRALCTRHRVAQSVCRIGSSQDNAVAESFWATLKRELVSRYPVCQPCRSPPGDHHLDQPLQRASAPFDTWQRDADRLGATLRPPSSSSRITTCPAGGGQASAIAVGHGRIAE
jgi:transposase InsO family protein